MTHEDAHVNSRKSFSKVFSKNLIQDLKCFALYFCNVMLVAILVFLNSVVCTWDFAEIHN